MKAVRSTTTNPSELDALVTLAQREQNAGRLAEAAAAYREILALRPDIAEANANLGVVLANQGSLEEAASQLERAVELQPQLIQAHNILGEILGAQGKLDQAAMRFRQVLALDPDIAETHYNLGGVLVRQGKLDEAATHFERAAALRPELAEAHNNLGIVRGSQGQLDQAVASFVQALTLRPDYAEAHNNLGNLLVRQGKFQEAAAHFERAATLRPDLAEARNNLGNVLRQQGKLDEAAARYQQAIALAPSYAEAHYNLGFTLREQGKLDEAAASYRQALTLRPDYADAQLGLAACYLAEGDYERGWPMYEGRLAVAGFVPQCNLPRWTGQPLAGHSILLVAEQGLGDTLQFVRYSRRLKERGAQVVLACQQALGQLLASQPDCDELFILGSAAEMPRCDFYLPLLSAPCAFGTTTDTIPCDGPYIAADPALIESWQQELAAVEGFKIGIVWQGARDYPSDRQRSIPLADFGPLARVPGVRLISLQKGFGSEQVAGVDFPVLDLGERLDETAGPFMDTAAVIRGVDLVVTPDTAIAHLAGALGAPVWLALQFSPTWRWLRGRDDSPWYPTARLFRQTRLGQWADVFQRVAAAVEAHLARQP
ncbi:MAG TPA: tetratricopeptide repeat protein [Pirellulales bacterium]|jgi:tetratricopeptide (TPR) repeat protein|nr:tetratricopeptide repeat protein [Pirellulales bacterium]